RISTLFPLLCACAALVLSIFCLFAGHKPGFLEEYHIITLNTSTLGHNIIPTTAPSSGSTPSLGSIFGSIARDFHSSIGGEIGSDLNSVIGHVTDQLAAELGIQQWYSMHLMGMCEGTYSPDATTPGTQLNVSSCTKPTAMYHFDISDQLSKELQLGKLHFDLSAIGWPSDIQNGLNNLSTALDTLFVLYTVGATATGLVILGTLITLVTPTSRFALFYNWGLISLSFLSLLIASAVITIVQIKAVGLINRYGNEIGVYAYKGNKYMFLTWAAVVVMLLAGV
ncbi:hypothetical protein M430DRAFT_75514, partial [Amorphotheca resinae ATCC 22711]